MKEVIFNYKDYTTKGETYKDFYRDIVIKLDAKNNIDFSDEIDLHFNGNILNEFIWYYHNDNLKLIMLNINIEKIKKQKTTDDYMWGIILRVIKRFVTEYPNNMLEFRNE